MNEDFLFGSRLDDESIKNQIKTPLIFHDKPIKINPLVNMNTQINGNERFAITSKTEGGKYVRGGLLFFSMNGVEIYAPINSVIMVDNVNKTLFIREAEKISAGIAPEDPEQRQYIVLYTDLGYDSSEKEFPLRWESVIGRLKAYESIKANASVIDPDQSIVLVETVALKDSLTVREFVKYLQNANLTPQDDDFDIDIYTSNSDYI